MVAEIGDAGGGDVPVLQRAVVDAEDDFCAARGGVLTRFARDGEGVRVFDGVCGGVGGGCTFCSCCQRFCWKMVLFMPRARL